VIFLARGSVLRATCLHRIFQLTESLKWRIFHCGNSTRLGAPKWLRQANSSRRLSTQDASFLYADDFEFSAQLSDFTDSKRP
jgi:hypothetical protein